MSTAGPTSPVVRLIGAALLSLCLLVLATCGREVPLGSGPARSADAGADAPLDWAIGGIPPDASGPVDQQVPAIDARPDRAATER